MKILKVALIVVILIIVILAISGSNIFGAVLVSDISLEKRGDSTLVTIMANNPFQFNSSSVPAKEGRPFRILIDCKDALHNLPKYDFRSLPSGIVTSIRTSQYQTDPNRVVRIVLDVAKTVNYDIHTSDNSLVITLVSMGEPDFERWSAEGVTAPVTAGVEKTEPVSPEVTPEQSTVSASPESTVPQEPTETTTTEEATSSTEIAETPEQTVASAEGETPTEPTSTEPVVTEAVSPEPSSTFTEVPSPETMVGSDTEPSSVASEVVDTTAPVTDATPTEETKTEVTETPSIPTEPSQKAVVKKEPKKSPVVEEHKSEATTESKVAGKDTQLPTITEEEGTPIVKVMPSQIQEKALQSLETFPKRKMIQYRSLGKRDPFSPLVGDKKVTEFGQAPIPSIENLKLVGVLQDLQGNKALLEDNRGYGYIMEPGDRVKNGTVILVDEDRVVFQIQEYGWSRNVALDLYTLENK
ncbi:MAG TPA: hypothetical protein VJ165_03280 [candidate division Zixibacteria bacterium]|nr:hypothetical protein [candidate division Zixibacteria bacterium]